MPNCIFARLPYLVPHSEPSRLAIILTVHQVSERGVVFFRKQASLTPELQKELALQLGALTGRPTANGLHIHPLVEGKMEIDFIDRSLNVISSQISQKLEGQRYGDRYRFSSGGVHIEGVLHFFTSCTHRSQQLIWALACPSKICLLTTPS